MKTQIKISKVLELLANGYTRTTDNKNYNPEIGSIQEYYNLEGWEIKRLFEHPKLVGRKTIIPKELSFELDDDVVNDTDTFEADLAEKDWTAELETIETEA